MPPRLIGTDSDDPWLPDVVHVHADQARIDDVAGYFDSTDVEGALAELRGDVDALVISGGGIATASGSETVAGVDATKAVTPAGLAVERPYLDVRTFGALGDNVADDTAAVQAALTGAAAGATITFPPGRYRVTAPLTWTGKELHLVAVGRAVLVQAATLAVPVLEATSAHDSTIDGLTIEGNETAATWDGLASERAGVRFTSSDRVTARGVRVTGKSRGVHLKACTCSQVVGAVITGFAADGIVSPNFHNAVLIDTACDGTHVIGLRARNVGSGVLSGGSSTRTLVDGGAIDNFFDNAVYISSGDYAIVRGVTVLGPTVTVSARPGGIKVRGGHHIVANNMVRHVAVGITLSASQSDVAADAYGSNGAGSVASGNVIMDCSRDGISLASAQDVGPFFWPRHFRVIGNTIEDTAQDGTTYAAIRGTGHGHQVIGNIIDKCSGTSGMVILVGVAGDPNVDMAAGVVVANNTFVGVSPDDIRLSRLIKAVVSNNVNAATGTANLVNLFTVTDSVIANNSGLNMGRVVRMDAASVRNRITDNLGQVTLSDNNWIDLVRASDPNSALIPASPGSIYHRTDGGAGTSLYVKETGTSTGGWVGK